MKNIALKTILSAAALTLTAGISMNAAAGQMSETLVHGQYVPTKTVTYSRAELNTEQGLAALERRIQKAAKKVCGPMDYRLAGGLSRVAKNRECYNQAVAQAMTEINAGQVASILN